MLNRGAWEAGECPIKGGGPESSIKAISVNVSAEAAFRQGFDFMMSLFSQCISQMLLN